MRTQPLPAVPTHELTDSFILKCSGVVFILSQLVYIISLPKGPLFGDGLEFVAAAAVGGVPHPTGYPLITELLGPFSGSYWSAAWACSFFASLFAVIWTLLCGKILMPAVSFLKPQQQFILLTLLGLLGAFATSVWSTATIVEVYGLNALLMLASLLILARKPTSILCWRQLTVVGLLLGLGLTNHLSCLALVPLFGLRFTESFYRKHTTEKTLAFPVLAFLLPIVVLYGLLMIRASANPPINWGGASDVEGLKWLLKGGDYKATQFLQDSPGVPFTLQTYLPYAGTIAFYLTTNFGGQLLGINMSSPNALLGFCALLGLCQIILITIGYKLIWLQSRLVFAGLISAAGLVLFLLFTYRIPDIADYFLGLYCIVSVPFLFGFKSFLERGIEYFGYRQPEKRIRLIAIAALLVAVAFLSNSREGMRQNHMTSSFLSTRLAEGMEPNALLITQGDYDSFGFWYYQLVEKQRNDVYVVAANYMRHDWYQTMLPEKGADPHGRYVEVQPGVFSQFTLRDHYEMIRDHIIIPHLGKVPVYITNADVAIIEEISKEFQLLPAAELLSQDEFDAFQKQGTIAWAIPSSLYKIVARKSNPKQPRTPSP